MKRWVVQASDARTLAAIVRAMGEDETAIDEGRVFVGKTRASPGTEIAAGDAISVHPRRRRDVDVEVLCNAHGVLAVVKPAGIPTIADQAGRAGSLQSSAARAAGVPESRVHPTSRLDREVSGVVVFATSDRARDDLAEARARGQYERLYVAIASGASLATEGTWDAPIGRHARDPKLRAANGRDSVAAATRFRVVARVAAASLLAVRPVTGRTHQIRVHAANASAPLFGDRAYGGPTRVTTSRGSVVAFDRIALHCARVRVVVGGRALDLEAKVPEALRELWRALGGGDGDWADALA